MKPLSICGWGLLALSIASPVRSADRPPNVVLIYSDDQGVGDVSGLNPHAKFATPHLDRLIREGMTFTDGHSSDTVCTPSRYGLLTGRYSWRTEMKFGVMGADVEKGLIEPGRLTLASLLQAHGYQTGMFGKWHLGMQFDGDAGNRDWSQPFRDGPIDRGFDEFFGIPASMNFGVLTWLQGDQVLMPADQWTAKKPGMVTHDPASYRITPPYDSKPVASPLGGPLEVAADFDDVEALGKFTQHAVDFIDRNHNRAFFAYVPLTSPHKPVVPHEEFSGASLCGAYGDFMVETDYRVGQILAALDRWDLAENTLVVFTSDNGAENTFRARATEYGHHSSGKFRGGKRDLYEGGHRVPFLVRWPRVIEGGSRCDAVVCQTDLLATMAEVLGVSLPANAGEDSQSFRSAFEGRPFDRGPVIHHGAAGHFAIREGGWKLLLTKEGRELYDLGGDPGESTNVIESHVEVADRLFSKFREIVDNGRSTPGQKQANQGGNDPTKWCRCCRP